MEKFILSLISEKVTIENKIVGFKPPKQGFKKRISDWIANRNWRKFKKNNQGFPLIELTNVLNLLDEKIKPENRTFVITVTSENQEGIQIVHSYLNNDYLKSRSKEFGISVYLTFDKTFEETIPLLKKFKERRNNFENLNFFIHDEEVECYDIYCETDKSKVLGTVESYFKEIVGEKGNIKYYFSINEMGKVE